MSFNPFSLEGKSILVTGASSGIGRQTAISCSNMGARVVITGRDAGRLEETYAKLRGDRHAAVAADLTDAESMGRLVDLAGVVEGVAHCAGISMIAPFRMVSEKSIDAIFKTNFHAPVLLTQRLLAKRQIANGGSIVFISSFTAHVGTIATSMYAASKGALLPAARALGLELATKQKIRVNCISPGYVNTPLLDGINGGAASIEQNYDLAPLGLGEPEDVANAIVFLMADASKWITRSTLIVDGGLTISVSIS
jgi:NAD(P)-dependent dehydrogenase (short-subunit alcohol dehydrogenase family)